MKYIQFLVQVLNFENKLSQLATDLQLTLDRKIVPISEDLFLALDLRNSSPLIAEFWLCA